MGNTQSAKPRDPITIDRIYDVCSHSELRSNELTRMLVYNLVSDVNAYGARIPLKKGNKPRSYKELCAEVVDKLLPDIRNTCLITKNNMNPETAKKRILEMAKLVNDIYGIKIVTHDLEGKMLPVDHISDQLYSAWEDNIYIDMKGDGTALENLKKKLETYENLKKIVDGDLKLYKEQLLGKTMKKVKEKVGNFSDFYSMVSDDLATRHKLIKRLYENESKNRTEYENTKKFVDNFKKSEFKDLTENEKLPKYAEFINAVFNSINTSGLDSKELNKHIKPLDVSKILVHYMLILLDETMKNDNDEKKNEIRKRLIRNMTIQLENMLDFYITDNRRMCKDWELVEFRLGNIPDDLGKINSYVLISKYNELSDIDTAKDFIIIIVEIILVIMQSQQNEGTLHDSYLEKEKDLFQNKKISAHAYYSVLYMMYDTFKLFDKENNQRIGQLVNAQDFNEYPGINDGTIAIDIAKIIFKLGYIYCKVTFEGDVDYNNEKQMTLTTGLFGGGKMKKKLKKKSGKKKTTKKGKKPSTKKKPRKKKTTRKRKPKTEETEEN